MNKGTHAALLLGAISLASAAMAESADNGGKRFNVALTGAAEVPGPGDADGSGTAELTVNPGQGRICYKIVVTGIEPATAAHIHIGASNQAGPVSQGLAAPTDGDSEGCADVSRALAQAIIKTPANYYVNVHNGPFPGGALRGQLAR